MSAYAELRSAKDVPPGNYAKSGQGLVGVVVGRGDPAGPDGSSVQVVVLEPGRASNQRGDLATLGGSEIVIDQGPVPVP